MTTRPIAVVTGASGGVGRATVRVFAEAGYDVALLARGIAGLEGTAKEVEAAGGRALVITTDVGSFEEVDAAATLVESELGPIDVWVNDAMTTVFAPTWEIDPEDFQRAVEVTFLGQVWGTMAALARMRPRKSGEHRQRRFRPCLHGDPPADRLLLLEFCLPGVLRVGARRTTP